MYLSAGVWRVKVWGLCWFPGTHWHLWMHGYVFFYFKILSHVFKFKLLELTNISTCCVKVRLKKCSVFFDLLFNLFRIALWPSVGKELSLWLFTCAVFILCHLNCRCPFPVWCLGQDVEFDCICSWSLPFYLLNYFSNIVCFYVDGCTSSSHTTWSCKTIRHRPQWP